MQKRIKKLIACLCCLAMMVPLCAIPASSDSEASEETSSSDSDAPMDEDDYAMDEDVPLVTDEEALAEMKLAVENDKLALW